MGRNMKSQLTIIPAIDLYKGKCVRLKQGKFTDVTVYETNPVEVAKLYQSQGASTIHIVDLDGTKSGSAKQTDIILNIKNATELAIQTGGGLRDVSSIANLLDKGINKVVLGSITVNNPQLIKKLFLRYGVERIVLALDVNVQDQPYIATHGWQATTDFGLWDLLEQYQHFTNLSILCTDIGLDGMLQGPNLELYTQCITRFPQFKFQASGGVSSIFDLQELSKIGVDAVIVGKALYETHFTLPQALKEISNVN